MTEPKQESVVKQSPAQEPDSRVEGVRRAMAQMGLDALIVRATDEYLNEYVPASESLRLWLTGFTGSVGDAVVTRTRGFVFVDGRYYLQAETETDPALFEVIRVPLGVPIGTAVDAKLAAIAQSGWRVGYEPEKLPLSEVRRLHAAIEPAGAEAVACPDNLVAAVRGPVPRPGAIRLLPIADTLTGESTGAKLKRLRQRLVDGGVTAQLVTRLDEVAWLTNLRGYELDYAATFRARAFVNQEQAVLLVDADKLTALVDKSRSRHWTFAPEDGLGKILADHVRPGERVLVDGAGTPCRLVEAVQQGLGDRGCVVEGESAVRAMKAVKNPKELAAMVDGFAKADTVVTESIAWLNRAVKRGKRVSEKDFAVEVERRFRAAGAPSLSFRVIAAAGANGAVIHYSNPDPDRRIRRGELMLLDTGGYFEAGTATDLTRTFLVGGAGVKPTREQQRIYTLVLKASIRGMSGRFPVGTRGLQLDAIVRGPIWQAGLDYLHGTGHGVGVLVHESPPSISNRSETPIEPGQVFSIEPGIYIPGWGGVRIENLVTVEPDPVAGFLRVRPLTFAPLDRQLIDARALTPDEKAWLRRYRRRQV